MRVRLWQRPRVGGKPRLDCEARPYVRGEVGARADGARDERRECAVGSGRVVTHALVLEANSLLELEARGTRTLVYVEHSRRCGGAPRLRDGPTIALVLVKAVMRNVAWRAGTARKYDHQEQACEHHWRRDWLVLAPEASQSGSSFWFWNKFFGMSATRRVQSPRRALGEKEEKGLSASTSPT